MPNKFTPGPWRMGEKSDNWWSVFTNENKKVAIIQPIHKPGNREKDDFDTETANARLIAAAPDLLEALQMAARFIEDGDNSPHTFFECREAWRNAFAKVAGNG